MLPSDGNISTRAATIPATRRCRGAYKQQHLDYDHDDPCNTTLSRYIKQ